MAKNTVKVKENTYRKEKEPDNEARRPAVSRPQPKSIRLKPDRRLQLTAGFLLLFASLYLSVAFISYLFTGKADQSTVDSVLETSMRTSGAEVENWLGLVGAVISHVFIFRWFGVASFLFLPILFLAGYKLVFRREIFPVFRLITFSLFAVVWISLLMGYLIFRVREETPLGFLSGGVGYEMAVISNELIGWGTLLLIIFSLVVFVIYFFNVTSVRGFQWKINETIKDIEVAGQEEIAVRPPMNAPRPKIIEPTRYVSESALNEELLTSKLNGNGHEWSNGKELTPISKPEQKTGLSLTIEERIEKDEPELEITLTPPDDDELPVSARVMENYDPTLDLPMYNYPPIELLHEYGTDRVQVSVEELEANKDKIVETLANYSIGIASIKATIGPTVTLYEIIPEAGVRISKIKNLEDDIALSLAALGIRIIAPIPGKGTIGIEVPNKNREMVAMRSVLATEKFAKSTMELPIVLGKTISNEIFITDLAKMPHLLMAGATGQGKSVGLNVILTSLIYKKHPSQLKFVLVDPKKVELTLFNKIERHFLAVLPDSEEAIITDTKKVVNTLNSLCIEMDMRYDLLKEAGCRNLKEYNLKFVERKLNPKKGHRFLPYIVLVIDELADLMMTAGKEVEQPIARLAQLARAIGIHLVVATQRPSVNVITGIIKANFPARLSFKVTSKIDSRTILDTGGADQLVGQGDMLLSMSSDLIRLQCAFVDTPEVDRICEFIGSQRGYETAYMLPEFEGDESGEGKTDFDPANRDPLFEEAARVIVTHQQGSTSLLQRRLKLGYNRAGRLIDQLESAGVVGPFEGSKAREVLIPDEHSLEQLLNKLNSN